MPKISVRLDVGDVYKLPSGGTGSLIGSDTWSDSDDGTYVSLDRTFNTADYAWGWLPLLTDVDPTKVTDIKLHFRASCTITSGFPMDDSYIHPRIQYNDPGNDGTFPPGYQFFFSESFADFVPIPTDGVMRDFVIPMSTYGSVSFEHAAEMLMGTRAGSAPTYPTVGANCISFGANTEFGGDNANQDDVTYLVAEAWLEIEYFAPPPPATYHDPRFRGQIYWSNSRMVQCWDMNTNTLTAVVDGDPRLPVPESGADFGPTIIRPDGAVMVPGNYNDDQKTILIFSTRLQDIIGKLSYPYRPFDDVQLGTLYDDPQLDAPVYDPFINAYWSKKPIEESGVWELTAIDEAGNVVAHAGDSQQIPVFGDAYTGCYTAGGNQHLLGRVCYFNLTFKDGLSRINLDTGAWEAIANYGGSFPEMTQHNATIILGTDETNGTYITCNIVYHTFDDYDPVYDHAIQVRDPNADGDGWINPIPDGISNYLTDRIGDPLVQWPLKFSTGGPQWYGDNSTPPNIDEFQANPVAFLGGCAYFLVPGGFGITHDAGDDYNVPNGYVTSLWELDLTTGSVAEVTRIPYTFFTYTGEHCRGDDPNFAWDNDWDPWGLSLAPQDLLEIDGQIDFSRARPYFG